MKEKIEKLLHVVKVHCITNYITAKEVANAIYALGAMPMLADDPDEVKDMTAQADALMINIGTLNARTIRSMLKAGLYANALEKKTIFAPVGAGRSDLRLRTCEDLLSHVDFDIIVGKPEELVSILSGKREGEEKVPATDEELELLAKAVSEEHGCVSVLLGERIIVSDSKDVYRGETLNPVLACCVSIPCILAGMVSAYVGADPDSGMAASITAVKALYEASELAVHRSKSLGLGTGFLDNLLLSAVDEMEMTVGISQVPPLFQELKAEKI